MRNGHVVKQPTRMEESKRKVTCKQAMSVYGQDGKRERVKVRCSCTNTVKG